MSGIHDFLNNNGDMKGNFDPNNPKDQAKINQLLSGMNKNDANKVMQVLNNPQEAQRLLQSPAAQKLLKILSGGEKNG